MIWFATMELDGQPFKSDPKSISLEFQQKIGSTTEVLNMGPCSDDMIRKHEKDKKKQEHLLKFSICPDEQLIKERGLIKGTVKSTETI